MGKNRKVRIWVDEDFKRQLKEEAARQDKSILELTKFFSKADTLGQDYEQKKKKFRMGFF